MIERDRVVLVELSRANTELGRLHNAIVQAASLLLANLDDGRLSAEGLRQLAGRLDDIELPNLAELAGHMREVAAANDAETDPQSAAGRETRGIRERPQLGES